MKRTKHLLAALLAFIAFPALAFGASPSLDGQCAAASGNSPASCSLTTTSTNDLIVAVILNESGSGGAASTVASVSGGSLTWTKHSGFASSHNTGTDTEVWTATSAGTLSAASISATFSGSIDGWAIVVFGVNGANATKPWDANGSIPAYSDPNSGTAPGATFSTSSSDDMLLVMFGGDVGNTDIATGQKPAGFTYINGAVESVHLRNAGLAVAYEQVSAIQSNISPQWGYTAGNAGMISDALTADAPGGANYMPFFTPGPF